MTPVFIPSEIWKTTYPGAHAGILAMHKVANPENHPELDHRKEALEEELRARFAGQNRAALEALPVIQAYSGYYKRFDKTYHILLQLDSVVFRGKPIPRVAALVEAMFMAEMQDGVLTAAHDLDTLSLPITLDVAKGSERYTLLRGTEQTLKARDMFIADTRGVISSILYGPDYRTRITPATQRVIFTVYAPSGVGEEAVRAHLQNIQTNLWIIAPEAEVETLQIFAAPPTDL